MTSVLAAGIPLAVEFNAATYDAPRRTAILDVLSASYRSFVELDAVDPTPRPIPEIASRPVPERGYLDLLLF